MLSKAILFATSCHRGQQRRGNKLPYIVHPMAVASNVRKYVTGDKLETLMVAALLHDVVEDCGVELKRIENEFNTEVESIVSELTSDPAQIALVGKTKYLQEKMLHMSDNALTVKLCDRLDNLQDLEDSDKERSESYVQSTLDILEYLKRNRVLTPTNRELFMDILKVKIIFDDNMERVMDILWKEL